MYKFNLQYPPWYICLFFSYYVNRQSLLITIIQKNVLEYREYIIDICTHTHIIPTFGYGVLYVSHHVVRVGETHRPVATVRWLVHCLNADIPRSDFARFFRRAVRVAKPGGSGTGHRIATAVERLVIKRRRPGRQRPIGMKTHMHGSKIVIDLSNVLHTVILFCEVAKGYHWFNLFYLTVIHFLVYR